jgi:hypothetical protein
MSHSVLSDVKLSVEQLDIVAKTNNCTEVYGSILYTLYT